jgi:hypothetical protein
LSDIRAGFNTSPWRSVISLEAHYRRDEDDSHYHNDLPAPRPPAIRDSSARDLKTDEIEAKLTLHIVRLS